MTSGKEEQIQIEELKQLKSQLKWWRWGLMGTAVVAMIACVATVDDAVQGLTKKGPRQEKFVSEMTAAMKQDIAPRVEDLVKQTLTEVKPEVQASISKVQAKMPQMAETVLGEMDKLQTNLPVRGEKVLSTTFGEMLTKKEAKLKEMFPEATDEQIERLLNNLSSSGKEVAADAAKELFSKHHETMNHIHENLKKIEEIEKPNLSGSDMNWELGLSVLDLFHEDLRAAHPEHGGSSTDSISAAQKVKK